MKFSGTVPGLLHTAILIATSGYAQVADREATALAGFDAHLAKPASLGEIYAAIEARLGLRRP